MIINYIKTENGIEVSLPLDWITVENMVEMYQNLSVHLWKRWQPSSSMPVMTQTECSVSLDHQMNIPSIHFVFPF